MEAFLICRHPTRPSMGNVPYDTPYILSHSPLINHSVIEFILSHSIGAVTTSNRTKWIEYNT